MFFGITKLGEKRVSHGVGKKCQPIDGFRALQNNVPNYPWADFDHRLRICSSKFTFCVFWSHTLFMSTILMRITATWGNETLPIENISMNSMKAWISLSNTQEDILKVVSPILKCEGNFFQVEFMDISWVIHLHQNGAKKIFHVNFGFLEVLDDEI